MSLRQGSLRWWLLGCPLVIGIMAMYTWTSGSLSATFKEEIVPAPYAVKDCIVNPQYYVSEGGTWSGQSSGGVAVQDPKNRFAIRNEVARRGCQNFQAVARVYPKIFRDVDIKPFANGMLEWCVTRKSGSSYSIYINNAISRSLKRPPTFDPVTPPKRFVVVRDPYSRLVSGYLDKFMTSREDVYVSRTRAIMELFRPEVTEKELACAFGISFYELVKYLIYSQETGFLRHSHFIPITEICDPCQKPFDFIVHLETYTDDMREVLKSVDISLDQLKTPEKEKKRPLSNTNSGKANELENSKKMRLLSNTNSVKANELENSKKKRRLNNTDSGNANELKDSEKKRPVSNTKSVIANELKNSKKKRRLSNTNSVDANEQITPRKKRHANAKPVRTEEAKSTKKILTKDAIGDRLRTRFTITLDNVTGCLSKHNYLKQLWWVYQAKGIIADDLPFDLTEQESENKSLDDVMQLFYDAQLNSVGRLDKQRQKRRHLVQLFLQIPLKDRVKVRDILAKDCLVFGYNTQPDDLFPELAQQIT